MYRDSGVDGPEPASANVHPEPPLIHVAWIPGCSCEMLFVAVVIGPISIKASTLPQQAQAKKPLRAPLAGLDQQQDPIVVDSGQQQACVFIADEVAAKVLDADDLGVNWRHGFSLNSR